MRQHKIEVLIIIPFENIYPPMNGGVLRSLNLLVQLSKYFRVTVISHQSEASFSKAFVEYPDLKKSELLSTNANTELADIFSYVPRKIREALRYRYWNRSLKGPAEGHFLRIYPVLKNFLKKKKVDFIIIESLFIVNSTAKIIRKYQCDTRIIYNAHNVDSKLAKKDFQNNRISKNSYVRIVEQEKNLSQNVDAILACSDQDLEELKSMNKEMLFGTVIPNGVKINIGTFKKNETGIKQEKNNILFCASLDYFPNREGLTWFCKEIFPIILTENPLATLMVVGKGDPGEALLELLKHTSIIYYGMVESVIPYYQKANVAIVPLLSGSGTRLKLLEAMGNKVAVVSTTIGAEGINYTNEKNIIIGDGDISFAKSVNDILKDDLLSETIASGGFQFVKDNYDWDIIGKKLKAYIEEGYGNHRKF